MNGLANALPDDVETLKAMLLAERARADRLTQIIKELQRHRFGRRAETLPLDQLELGLEDVQQAEAAQAAETEKADPTARSERARQRRTNRGALPAHLPRVEVVVDVDSKLCPWLARASCTASAKTSPSGWTSSPPCSIPALLRVLVTRRPKYACRACEEGVVQAPAPARLIEGGLPTEATVAHVIVGKYADHLPLYRQAQIYARQGVQLDRSTLADWVGRAAWLLGPVHARLLERLKASQKHRQTRCRIAFDACEAMDADLGHAVPCCRPAAVRIPRTRRGGWRSRSLGCQCSTIGASSGRVQASCFLSCMFSANSFLMLASGPCTYVR